MRPARPHSARTGERGYTLIAVLWAIAALSAIAFVLLQAGRTETSRARNIAEAERARILALSGIEIGRAALTGVAAFSNRPGAVFDETYILDRGHVRVEIADETGRIDLNTAAPELLTALFVAAGVDQDQAQSLVQRIADYRDPDDAPHEFGAEAAEYATLGLPFGPKNAPFDHISELQAVAGVGVELYRTVAPLLTLQSGLAGVDVAFAPEDVLQVMPGVTEEDVRMIHEMRETGATPEQIRLLLSGRGELEFMLDASPGRFVRVLSTGMTQGGTVRQIEAVADVRRRTAGLPPLVAWGYPQTKLKKSAVSGRE